MAGKRCVAVAILRMHNENEKSTFNPYRKIHVNLHINKFDLKLKQVISVVFQCYRGLD